MDRMKRKFIGAVLTAFGLGILIAAFIPIWGTIAALVIAAVGIYLICDSGCCERKKSSLFKTMSLCVHI